MRVTGSCLPGQPVYKLLRGRVRDKVRMYTHLGSGETKAVSETFDVGSLIECAHSVIEKGYRALKVVFVPYSQPLIGLSAKRHFALMMAKLRDVVGPEVDILADFHERTTTGQSIEYIRASIRLGDSEPPDSGRHAVGRSVAIRCGTGGPSLGEWTLASAREGGTRRGNRRSPGVKASFPAGRAGADDFSAGWIGCGMVGSPWACIRSLLTGVNIDRNGGCHAGGRLACRFAWQRKANPFSRGKSLCTLWIRPMTTTDLSGGPTRTHRSRFAGASCLLSEVRAVNTAGETIRR